MAMPITCQCMPLKSRGAQVKIMLYLFTMLVQHQHQKIGIVELSWERSGSWNKWFVMWPRECVNMNATTKVFLYYSKEEFIKWQKKMFVFLKPKRLSEGKWKWISRMWKRKLHVFKRELLKRLTIVKGLLYRGIKRPKESDIFKLVIPEVLKHMLLESVHSTGHQGRDIMLSILKPRCYWVGITKDVEILCKELYRMQYG